jgi:hypothetical protein
MYFLLAGVRQFHYPHRPAIVLTFIGVKMLIVAMGVHTDWFSQSLSA